MRRLLADGRRCLSPIPSPGGKKGIEQFICEKQNYVLYPSIRPDPSHAYAGWAATERKERKIFYFSRASR
jgi:hypothetical protein